MSTGAGGAGLGTANIQVLTQGAVELPNGAQVNVTTAEGMAEAGNVLDQNGLAELKSLMSAQGYKFSSGVFVPEDKFAQGPASLDLGPNTEESDLSDTDKGLIVLFKNSDTPSPYNPNTTPNWQSQLKSEPSFQTAVSSMTANLENPSPANQEAAMQAVGNVAALDEGLNIYELLFLVFRESIEQTNLDKAYFLTKIQEYNDMAEGLSDYLGTLVEKSQELSEKSEGEKEPEKIHVDVQVKRFDLNGLGADGKITPLSTDSKRLERAGLNDEIKHVESMQETVRNKRQMASTSFQNFDQKANQLYNLMSSVLKATNEMRSGTVRNML
ncbi:MAG: hypothetical protein HOK97_10525 [Deltaproteobacteria bacterium]|jgi:hypothetical protein|nr:hypothetical protein [Deltaproteobacteria bacterium]MBT6490187.1 hypothetical protein [Deltaproteobacteria bacterium]